MSKDARGDKEKREYKMEVKIGNIDGVGRTLKS